MPITVFTMVEVLVENEFINVYVFIHWVFGSRVFHVPMQA